LKINYAGVAEWVDAQDLKSCGGKLPCRFESDPRHFCKPSINISMAYRIYFL
jgi:hypothetical protein